MTLSTVKGAIFNLVHLIYVGSCYYKPKCLYTVTYVFFTVTNFPFRHELKNVLCILYL